MPDLEFNIGEAAVEGNLPGTSNYLPNNGAQPFFDFLSQIMGAVMGVASLLVLLYFIWGAIEWISSGGDKTKTEKARNRMTQAVVGIIVLATTLAIFVVLQQFLGLTEGTPPSSGFIPSPACPAGQFCPEPN